jgi:cytochrome c551/c552
MIMNNYTTVRGLSVKVLSSFLFLFFILLSSLVTQAQTADAAKHFVECKACHTIGGGRLVGPDLKGVTEKYSQDWLIGFIRNSQEMIQAGDKDAVKIFNEYSKIPMPSHPNLTDEQIIDLLLYIKNGGKVAGAEVVEKKAVEKTEAAEGLTAVERNINNQRTGRNNVAITAMIMALLLILSLIDLIFTHYLKAKWVHYIVILTALWVIGEWIFDATSGLGRQQYYQPDQPIWFSHKVHAGQNKIDCEYCHFTAETSMHAGIPPASVCMNCHSQVKEGKRTGKKEIEKIYAAIKENKPIEWIKVHNLPDHVYFNHAQHVNAGKLDCAECHGDVAQMDQVAQVKDLSMGWCIDCHRTKSVQFATNKFYQQYKKLHEKFEKGEIKKVTPQMLGGDECQKCHY